MYSDSGTPGESQPTIKAALENLHWGDVSGGVNAKAPRRFPHGYVWCNEMIWGELDHSCRHGPGPHRIKVCIVKIDNKEVWPQILKAV